MADFWFEECKHKPFDYRPYRRGKHRCLTCGGYKPLSLIAKNWINELVCTVERDMSLSKKAGFVFQPLAYEPQDFHIDLHLTTS